MNLWLKGLVIGAALAVSTTGADAAQQSDVETRGVARKFRYLQVETREGAQLPAATVSYLNGKGEMVKGEGMPDGTSMVWERSDQLTVEVKAAGHEGSILEIDTRGIQPEKLRIIVDEATGKARYFPVYTREAQAMGMPDPEADDRVTQSSNLISIPTPHNDDCQNAESLYGDHATALYTTLGASTDGAYVTCDDYYGDVNNDVWYCWTAPCTGKAIFGNCASVGDSVICVYEGCACPGGPGGPSGPAGVSGPSNEPVACSDNACGPLGLLSEVHMDVVEGQQYKIRVGNYPHEFPLSLIQLPTGGLFYVKCIPTVVNDDCENATYLTLPASVDGSTRYATMEEGSLPKCGPYVTSAGVWYEVTGTGYKMEAKTCGMHTDFDTKISVFCRDCGPDLTCVAGRDGGCGSKSRVSWCSQEGATYRILVHGRGYETGDFRLRVNDLYEDCYLKVRCRFEGACCDGESCSVVYEDECGDSHENGAPDFDGGYSSSTFFGDLTDCCGKGVYDIAQCDDSFEDISATGTHLWLGDDDGERVHLGFGFNHFGEQYFKVGVSSNGYCAFGYQYLESWKPKAIPSQSNPDALAAPYWGDWSPQNGGSVQYETRGEPGSRRCIVQWTNVPHYSHGGSNTFQAVFYEGSDEIKFKYGPLALYFEAPPIKSGIENRYGSHGYANPGAANNCVCFTPRWAPLCDGATALEINQETYFSDLDGSYYDLDGEVNDSLQVNGLIVNSILLVDVECARFDIQGDLTVNGGIRGVDTPASPHTGPKMDFCVCESVWLNPNSLIRSNGAWCGGTVNIYAGGDFHSSGVSGIQAKSNATYGGKGGWITVSARGRIEQGFQGFMSVKGEKAGHIKLISCDGHERAISIKGTLNAAGWGPYGCGGCIRVKARQGGIYMTGDNSAYAAGDEADGHIFLKTAWIVTPLLGPWTTPDPYIHEYWTSYRPCECKETEDDEDDEIPVLIEEVAENE